MDYWPDTITVRPGCFERVCELLTQIFHKGPTDGERGEKRWRIVKKDISWYSPAEHQPTVRIWAFDLEKRDIINYLKAQKLVA